VNLERDPSALDSRRASSADDPSQALIAPDDLHNRTLVANVHPQTWTNPVPDGRYNLVVLGGGTAGLVSAIGAAMLGAKIALVERHLLGGDCLNSGCVPSKGLLRAARAAAAVSHAAALGIHATANVDFGAVMERMRRVRAGISHNDSVQHLSDLGVDVYFGQARFIAPDAIEVAGARLEFARAIIAAGARPATIPVPGLTDVGFLTNETVFSLTGLPRRLTVIGAGPIGCELAQAFRRLGSNVTLVSLGTRLLPRDDPDAAAVLSAQFRREGIEMLLAARILRAERTASGKTIVVERNAQQQAVDGDEILVAVGRTANIEDLALEAAGVACDKTGVKVDDRLRTTNRRIYAAGDICSGYKFTHAADAMARIALQNALFFGRKRLSAEIIPWCTYTDPEVAYVGLYRSEAGQRRFDVLTLTVPLDEIDRAILDEQTHGFARVHVNRRTGRILGATMVASHAGEMIGEMALAMNTRLHIGAVAKTIHPYPTQVEAWKRLGDAWSSTRLTPRVRWILERVLRWRR
jgi:pyruvate/2-oxoglutarate dehydrogenase complex dihydrolipoamide dehydrogenase (E3) component